MWWRPGRWGTHCLVSVVERHRALLDAVTPNILGVTVRGLTVRSVRSPLTMSALTSLVCSLVHWYPQSNLPVCASRNALMLVYRVSSVRVKVRRPWRKWCTGC